MSSERTLSCVELFQRHLDLFTAESLGLPRMDDTTKWLLYGYLATIKRHFLIKFKLLLRFTIDPDSGIHVNSDRHQKNQSFLSSCVWYFKSEWNRTDGEGPDLWWRVGGVQALLGGVAQWSLVRLVEREGLDLLVLPWGVVRAGQVAAAAVLGAPATSTAHRRIAELGDGARWQRSVVWRKTEMTNVNMRLSWQKKKRFPSLLS